MRGFYTHEPSGRAGRRYPAGPRRGLALLWALLIAFAAGSSAVVAVTLAASSQSGADNDRAVSQARGLSRAALALAEEDLAQALRSGLPVEPAGTAVLANQTVSWTIAPNGASWEQPDGSGLTAIVQTWSVEGRCSVDGRPVQTRRMIRSRLIPIFQFALFYEEDMHFLYPAPMTVGGPVHCNANVYFQAHKGLTFDTNHLHVAGEVFGGAAFPEWLTAYPWGPAGPVTIRNFVNEPNNPGEPLQFSSLESAAQMAAAGITTSGGYDYNFAGHDSDLDGAFTSVSDWLPFAPGVLEKFGPPAGYPAPPNQASLQTHSHGVQPVVSPVIEDFALFTPDATNGDHVFDAGSGTWQPVTPGSGTHIPGHYAQSAGLKIVVLSNGSYEVHDAAGNDITAAVAPAVSVSTLYDARQASGNGQSLDALGLDLSILTSLGHFPANGLIYLASESVGTGTDLQAFKLSGGSELPDELMVVSPDALYLHGDYNTINSKPCGVMADAVNLLSNNWDGSKSPGNLPTAAATTFKTSILTGDVPGTAANFNGGPHNLVRLHEHWSGKTLSIEGSLVCLGHSLHATGDFKVYGDYYTAPNRDWRFDPDLSDPDNLPPYTPAIVEVLPVIEL
jgi:hypothetical protein